MSSNNTSETVYISPTAPQATGSANTAGTVYQPESSFSQQPILLVPGTNVNGYMIMETISNRGSESVVYRAMKSGSDYALKLYKREVELSESKMQALMQLQCPYVAKLCDYGIYADQPYEIYPFYKNGTLENKGRVEGELLKRYINQLNEALHSLHTAQGVSGMVHGDLKPSNIFLSDDGNSLLLGDFGVSNVKTAEGAHFARICGTPEFAPPSTGVMDRMKKSPAYDYGALGLVVFYMATGYSYFLGCSSEEIAAGWESGIRLPDEMDTRIKLLLKGLLQFEESRRFGYEQVFDWYKGSFVQAVTPKSLYRKKQSNTEATLWFGIFDGQSIDVSSVEELVLQMKLHWDQAILKLRDSNFYHFINSFYPDGSIANKIQSFLEEGDNDAAVFKTIYTLSDNAEIVYKGRKYGTAAKLIEALAAQDADAKELISKGLFLFYMEAMGYPADTYRNMQDILSLKNCPERFKTLVIGYMFAEDKRYNDWSSIDDLRSAVCNMTLTEIDELVTHLDFLAWLYTMGMKEQALSIVSARGEDE